MTVFRSPGTRSPRWTSASLDRAIGAVRLARCGVSHTASDDEVRSAHRRLVRDYHPDVIQSKGLPADFMKFATEKSTAINEAWAAVRKERGM